MLLVASFKSSGIDDLIGMHPIDREFLYFWMREKEFDQMQQFGRMLGVMFNAGEVRGWDTGDTGPTLGLDDTDSVFVPLSFMLRPESREGVQKMVGKDTQMVSADKKQGNVVVDLGKVSKEIFQEFVEKNRVAQLKG